MMMMTMMSFSSRSINVVVSGASSRTFARVHRSQSSSSSSSALPRFDSCSSQVAIPRIQNNMNTHIALHYNIRGLNYSRTSNPCQQQRRRWKHGSGDGATNTSQGGGLVNSSNSGSRGPSSSSTPLAAEPSPNTSATTASTTTASSNTNTTTFLQRFLGPKPMPPRNTPRWYAEMLLLCTVFGITGSSTMFLVRPAVSNVLGLEGSFKDGEICFYYSCCPKRSIYFTLKILSHSRSTPTTIATLML